MKFFFIIVILLSFTSCTGANQASSTAQNKSDASSELEMIDMEEIPKVTLPVTDNGEILFKNVGNEMDEIIYFEDDWLLYSTETSINQEEESGNHTLFHYNIQTGESKKITKIKSRKHASGSVVTRNGKVYYPFTVIENQQYNDVLLEIDQETLETRRIDLVNSPTPLGGLISTQTGIFREYYSWLNDETTHYLLDFIDVDRNGENKTILKYTYDYGGEPKGEMMIGVDIKNDRIYAQIEKTLNRDTTPYLIREHTLDGTILNEYELDIEDFLDTAEETNFLIERDSIFTLIKENHYFIMNTINKRNCIFKQQNNEVEPVPIPNELKDFNVGANLISVSANETENIYFLISSDQPGPRDLLIFNSSTGQFSHRIHVEVDGEQETIENFYADVYGNIIVKIRIDTDMESIDNSSTHHYYFISKEQLKSD